MGIARTGWVSNIDQEAQIPSPSPTNLSTHEKQYQSQPQIHHHQDIAPKEAPSGLPAASTPDRSNLLPANACQDQHPDRQSSSSTSFSFTPFSMVPSSPFHDQETFSVLKYKTSSHETPLSPTHLTSVQHSLSLPLHHLMLRASPLLRSIFSCTLIILYP